MPSGEPIIPPSVGGKAQRNIEAVRDVFRSEVKTIKSTANVLFLREVILFACIALVIAGATGGIWYSYRKRQQAEQRAWMMEQERRRLEEEERQRQDEARKKAREEERLAEERERKRREAEEQARLEAQKAEELRRRRFAALVNDFKEIPLGYLRNAPREVLPGGVQSKTAFSCLMADEVDGLAFFRVHVTPGEPMSVLRFSPEHEPKQVPTEDFNKRCQEDSYLMVADGRPYFNPVRKPVRTHPVPRDHIKFNPSREEFGELYGIVKELGLNTSLFRYDVYLQLNDGSKPLLVKQSVFGEELSNDIFRRAARERLEQEARWRAEEYSRDKAAHTRGGRTRSGQVNSGMSSLERKLADAQADIARSQSRNRTVVTGGNIIYQSRTEYYGPTKHQRAKVASLERRLAAETEARARRQEAAARRQAEADTLFQQENAVTEAKVDAFLGRCTVTFRAAQ